MTQSVHHAVLLESLQNLRSRAEREALLTSFVRERAAAVLGVPLDAVDPGRPLTALGLDSLAAAELRAAIEEALGVAPPLADLLEGVGVRALAARLAAALEAGEAGGGSDAFPIPGPLPAGGDAPLSAGQQALWFVERLAPTAGTYNLAVAAHVRGPLDAGALRRALALLAERHPALRTVFPLPAVEDGEPVQRVLDRPAVDFREEDAGGWSERRLAARLAEEAWRPFDLADRPPLRVRLYGCAGSAGPARALLVVVHHLIADFGSLAVVARELGELYRQELGEADRKEPGGAAAGPAPPALTPAEHARRQAAMLAGPRGERLWAYWRAELSGADGGSGGLADLDLPTDRPRPPVQTYRGTACAAELPPALAAGLRELASARGATLFMALLAGFQALLARLSGQQDFAVGSPAAGRTAPELAGAVGYFVNPVALRARLAGDPSFADLLGRTRRTVLAGLEHGDFPFPLVAERLRPARDPARPPVFQVLFVLPRGRPGDDPGLAELALGEGGVRLALGGPAGLRLESIRLPAPRAPFDLTLRVAERGSAGPGGLAAVLEANADLFDGATAARLLGQLRVLLAGAVADPGLALSRLPLLSEPERRQVLVEWSTGAGLGADCPAAACLHELVAAQAARTPGANALVAGGARLTYAELDRRADRLARHLAALGVGPESRVGLCLRRNAEMVVAMLAVLKAGGAYVPLDPAYPPARLELMLADSGARVVLAGADAPLSPALSGDRDARGEGAPVFVDPAGEPAPAAAHDGGPPAAVRPGNLAYLIYTSGSTGRPKAVAIEHRSAVALVRWAAGAFTAAELAGVVASTSISFDLSVFEIFVPLARGGAVLLAENALEIPRLPAAAEATLVNTVPSALAELVRAGGLPPSVRTVNLAGEPVPAPLVEAVHRLAGVERLYNLYGPSEDTTYSTWGRLAPDDAVTIGRPLDGTRAYVLDRQGAPVPAGVPGELLLGGDGLARGYLGRPDLTAERFAPDPFGPPGGRLYRTGDLVRWRTDGRLDFLGRLDHQVKIRGFRVELGEIEAALARHPALCEAAVVAVDDGGVVGQRRLVACVTAASPAAPPAAADLRSHLAAQLPSHMVPAAFAVLAALPLSSNGKVDRKALARLAAGERTPGPAAPAGARTPVEAALADAMAEVLGCEAVGIHDDFFALGGHSLLATRLAARLSRLLGVDLPVSAVFQTPTVAGLAAAAGQGACPGEPIRRAARAAGEAAPLSFAQERLWFLDRLEPGAAVYVLPGAVDLSGELAVPALAAALAEVVRRHAALRTTFAATAAGPVQVLTPAASPSLPVVDLGALPEPVRRSAADRLARAAARRPFDLARGPLCRFVLLRLAAHEHRLLASLHHIVADGWSLALLLDELAVLSAAARAGAASPLPEPAVQYADYAAWQRGWLQGEVLARELAYWRRLDGLPLGDLPADRPRPPVRTSRGATRSLELAGELGEAAAALARGQGATLFMALLATVQALLARWTGADAVAVGSPVANRGRAETEGLIGLFVNTLVLDVRAGDDPPFREVLARTREACLGAYAHQELPFERLVEELQPRRDPSRNPLFQVLFVLEEPPRPRRAGGLAWEPRRVDNGTAKFDLTFSLEPRPRAGWRAAVEYATALFEPATVDRLLGHWQALLAGAAADPGVRLSALPGLTPAERRQLVHERSAGGAAPPPAVPHSAAAEPLAPAVLDRAERLAEIWREVLGVERVGIHDDFFALGGHSLLAARVAFQVAESFGVDVPVGVLFQAPTAAALAAWLEGAPAGAPAAVGAAPGSAADPRPAPRPAVRPGRAAGPALRTPPQTSDQERLAEIWSEVLGVAPIGVDDDFLELGGHSLLAYRIASLVAARLGVALPASSLFEAPTVAALARRLAAAPPAAPLAPAAVAESYPLSLAQQRLWVLDRLEPGSPVYNLWLALRLAGRLDARHLAAAVAALLARHEPLRTVYAEVDGRPVQIVLPSQETSPLRLLDLAGLPAAARAAALRESARAEVARPFDLERGPVARFLLVRLFEAEHVLVATVHHIAADGWSMEVLGRDLAALYSAAVAGLPSPLPPLPLRYVDHAVRQREALSADLLAAQLAGWRRELAGLPALELPADRPRSPVAPVAGRRGATRRCDLPAELAAPLAALGRGEGLTLFVVLLGGFVALLSRWSGQEDFAVGAPAAGRQRPETAQMVGFFVNTLVLRARLDGDPGFRDLLRRLRGTFLAAQARQDVPFERLVEELQGELPPASSHSIQAGSSPLVQAMLAFWGAPPVPPAMPGLTVELADVETTTAKFDLTLSLLGGADGLAGWLETRSELFDRPTAARFAAQLRVLLAGAAGDPARRVSELPLLAAGERWQLLGEWNDTAVALALDTTLDELVAAQIERTPDAVAVDAPGAALSYRALGRAADRLARRLRRLGVGPEVPVGLAVERGPAMVVGMLGILAAGGAVLPLDPEAPGERQAFLLAAAGAPLLLVREPWPHQPPAGTRMLGLEEMEEAAVAPAEGAGAGARAAADNLACVLFTSGSTGLPKGVALAHRGLVNRLLWAQATCRLTADDAVLQKAPVSFDFALWECFGPLIAGARLVLARPGGHRDPRYLAQAIAGHQVTLVHFVPALLEAFLREEGSARCVSLRHVFCGGEALAPGLRDRFLARLPIPLENQYGPAEISIDTTRWVCAPGQEPGRVPIGRPIGNTRIHLLDRRLRAVPPGVVGELLVGGPGLARGYAGRPDLTAERFVPDPFGEGGRLYRTGDLARRLPDGTLEFRGRADDQLKVRGVRIEPREVEAALLRHPAVAAAAVAPDPEDASRLVAWWVARSDVQAEPAQAEPSRAEPSNTELRDALRRFLPEAMVPAAFVRLAALPLTPNGKLDRRALPAPPPPAGAAPRADRFDDPLAELLAGLWSEVLEVERVGPDDSFFDSGGHSLLAARLLSRVRAACGVDLPFGALFEAPTPAGLARRVAEQLRSGGESAAAPPPLVREEGSAAPLSFGQQRLWFLHRLDPESDAYHVPGVLRLAGDLREAALERAVEEIVRRHEVLRTVYSAPGRTPVQAVLPAARWTLPVVDLAALPGPEREAEAQRLVAGEARRPFDLAADPPLRTLLLRLGEGERRLAVVMHHIASDAWSLAVLLGELAALYPAFAAGEPSPLAPLPVQYADFARWQRRWLAGETLEREVAHWRGALAGAPDSLALPYDRPAGSAPAGPAGRRPFALAPRVAADLAALARRSGWTLFMALLAGFQALLARLCHQEDVVVGAPIANRNRLEIEGLIGFFTNTLALRLDLSGDPPFAELGGRARAAALAAYAHQELPFEKLVEELAPERHLGRNPLFQVLLVVQKPPAALRLPGVAADLLEADAGAAKLDLVLSLVEDGAALTGFLEHDRQLFESATADRLLGHLGTLLAAAAADPGRRLSELPLLSAAEQAELAAWSRPLHPDPPAVYVHELVAEQARRTPDAVAVSSGAERLTYGELVRRSRRLAERLVALGVGPDVPAGLFLDRSPDQMVALLAVLAAGGAYLPLDPAYPAERLRLMLEDAGAPAVLTHAQLAGRVPPGAGAVVRVDEDAPAPPPETAGAGGPGLPETLVYVIYTSGSTGRPKGVALPHGALAALLAWQLRTSTAPAGRTLQFTSLSFDVSFQEVFSTWCAGGELVLVTEEVRRDPAALLALLAEQQVERLFLPFVALQQLATAAAAPDGALPAALREVLSAGEQLHVTPQVAALCERLPGAVLQNHYGPSETHVATWLALSGAPAGWPERVPIGRPLDHARVVLLDAGRAPVPPGVAGEVYVGGPGLARGYLARPDLTAERFVPDPCDWIEGWRPGERLYRTGDLARRRADGELEYLGRIDSQVKIRGHRLELAEVEAALARHPAVLQAAAMAPIAQGDAAGARRLAACVVFRPGAPVPGFRELQDFLAAGLPEPMVPSVWARLDAFPLTPSGKLDRRALAARIPAEEWRRGEAGRVPPRTPTEELLAGIWSQVLGGDRPGAFDDFFALGGHSLLVTQVASRIREVFAVDLPLRRLFDAPTLAAQAEAVAAAGAVEPVPPLRRGPRPLRLPLSFAQERLWVLDRLQPGGTAYNVPLALRAVGRLDAARLAAALAEVARRHEVLRTVFAERDGEPFQLVLPADDRDLPTVDLRGLPGGAREREARRLAAAEAVRPFDLARGPLLRRLLLELAPDERLLVLCLHHIAADGWSLGVLVREVQALYGLAAGAGSPLPELTVQYADFALWQRRWLAGEALERQLAYWRERLAGAPAALELPADRPRPPVLSMRGAEHRFALAGGLVRRIGALGLGEGVTPFMVLAAGLFSLLARLSGQRDLAVGAPIANRNRLETEGLIGFFVNTLVLRTEVERGETFRGLLRRVREVSLGAYAHQDVPFEKLVDELHPDRDLSRSPLFQVALLLQNAPLPRTELPGLTLEPVDLPATVAKFDLAFVFVEEGGGLAGALQYATDLFDAPTAARLAAHLATHLAQLVDRPGGLLAEAGLLSAPERQQLLREWNDTRPAAAPERLLHQLFEEQADRAPAALAAVWEGEELTYRGLEERANRLAQLLIELGAGRRGPRGIPSVGIWMERSLDLLAALLGILKSGASYLPLDPAWPAERVAAILAASEVRLLVAGSALLPAVEEMRWRLPLADVVCLDIAMPAPPLEPLDEAGVRGLWDFVADRATDRVTAGGFVDSFTGLPFAAAEVDEYRDRVLALAAPWLGPARPGARVLEVGCGSGLLLWEMAPRAARCIGLDPSPRTQEQNRERARAAGLDNVALVTGFAHEVASLLADEGPFDLVVMASTAQFFPGPRYLEQVVEQALRLLAPGGALLVADVPDLRRRDELRRALEEAGAPAARRELWLDEDLFGDLAALPGVARVEVLHRTEGFANELRFRYDVRITRGEEGAAVPATRRRRLWTGWHAARRPPARPPAAAGPDDVAYVIHTSGSTGVPKGIAVQHRPAVHLVRWVNDTFAVGAGDRLLFVTSPCFDLSVYDVFGTLAAGAALHVAPEAALRDPERLARTLRAEPVTIWDSAPAALQQLVPALAAPADPGAPGGALRLALLSGDWIPVRLPDEVRAAFPAATVISLGGATEATVWSNWYPVAEVDPRWPSIPYGRPIAGARYHVLDDDFEPCPIGVPGDLYIGGGCLCLGYARQPELTAASFLPDPFAPDGPDTEPGARNPSGGALGARQADRNGALGARLYRTGDRARAFGDGNLEFLGRRDQQVKVRGYRIELGEIEAALVRHPGVREAVAAVREDVPGDRRLVAYVVPAAPEPADPSAAPSTSGLGGGLGGGLRDFLLGRLPEYMVPWSFVTLAALPVTPNGKLDRAALPAPEEIPAERDRGAFVAPRNDLERAIGAIWREVLGRERVGIRESFFEVGGSSLLMARLQSRLRQALGREVPFVELFRHPTIEGLAASLREARDLAPGEPANAEPASAAEARARTETRRDAMRRLQQARGGSRVHGRERGGR